MRGIRLALVAALVMVCVAGGGAGAAVVPIEGKLLVEYWDSNNVLHAYLMTGDSSTVVPLPWTLTVDLPELSPDTAKVAYSFLVPSTPYPEAADIWAANLDLSDAVNLTDVAGLGGVNCNPAWSPDGRMIAFNHSDPTVGQLRCGSGFQVWLMNADGTNLHQWISSPTDLTMSASWAPDGYIVAEGPAQSCLTGDITGANLRTLPGVNGRDVEWSRDGATIAYTTLEPATEAGEPGVWERLCLSDRNGSNVQVLVQQFVKDSDIATHIAKYNPPDDPDWFAAQLRWWVGPRKPRWSPLGDRVAFLAAFPFDPNGPEFWYQVEVWIYDFSTGQPTRLTSDANWDDWLSWAGPNTSATSPEVTVNNTTVTFAEVSQEGLTTILLDVDPPEPPSDRFTYDCYDIATTAGVSGDIQIRMTYTEDEVPVDVLEADLAVLRYNESSGEWDDITVSRDSVNNEVYGVTSSLSLFALHGVRRTRFADVPAWGYGEGGVDPYWAFWEIEACAAAGIVGGYQDGTYQPGSAVDRATMAVYIARALAGGEGNVPPGPAEATFDDVPTDNWAYDHVEYCYDQNVVQGYTATTYEPTVQVTRDQMAVYVARAMVAPTGEAALADYVPSDPRNFPDVPSTGYGDDGTEPFWAYKHIEYCVENGVVQGYLDGSYHPEYVVTRDQMAVYVARAFDLVD